jgi:UPF0176 protein
MDQPSTTNHDEISVATFYIFSPLMLERVSSIERELTSRADELQIQGLVILGPEGLNTTLSGEEASLRRLIDWIEQELPSAERPMVKWSRAPKHPFAKFKTKVRDEIVTLHRADVLPTRPRETYLSPRQWHEKMQDPRTVVIDTRNWYETRIGKFRGAIDPKIEEFGEFPEFVKSQGLDPDAQILVYCTGGIRCEKAAVAVEELGHKNVFQLEGGILNYIKEYPEGLWEGECFVFDTRVAVDSNLEPSKTYRLCPHCGQPAEVPIDCVRCDTHTQICPSCAEKAKAEPPLHTCSKNCANHWRSRPGVRGRPQVEVLRYRGVKV